MSAFTRYELDCLKAVKFDEVDRELALALYFMYYNFCRIHQTLPVAPAMEAGVSDHVWSLDEVLGLLDQ